MWTGIIGGVLIAVLSGPLQKWYDKRYGDDEAAGLLAGASLLLVFGVLVAIVAGVSYVALDW